MKLSLRRKKRVAIAVNFALFACAASQTDAQSHTVKAQVAHAEFNDEAALLNHINRERRKRGLTLLGAHVGLQAVARRHSAEMAKFQYLAHESPRTGSPADRAKKGGVASAVIMENVGLAPSVFDLHTGFLNSEGHRRNMLSTEVNHVGVGLIRGKAKNGATVLYATELFAWYPQGTAAGARKKLLRLVAQLRTRAGASPLKVDAQLQAAAEDAMLRYRNKTQPSESTVLNYATQAAKRRGVRFAFSGMLARTAQVEGIAQHDMLAKSEVRRVGVAVAINPGGNPGVAAIILVAR